MPFDGLTIQAVTRELDSILVNGRIDKIHQPEKDEIILAIRTIGSGTVRLLISANPRWARVHLLNTRKENPVTPPAFCMLLRKYLEGGKIKAVRQVGMDRVVHLVVEAMDDFREWREKLLVCEFMGRHSNIILINPENNAIIDAIKKYGSDLSSYREVLPGKEYVTPPDQGKLNPLESSVEDFMNRIMGTNLNTSLAEALFAALAGVSPYSAGQFCTQAGIDPDTHLDQCGEYELTRVYQKMKTTLSTLVDGEYHPFVALGVNHQPLEFAPYPLEGLPAGSSGVECSTMNQACDLYFGKKLEVQQLNSMKSNLSKHIKGFLDRLYRKRFLQEGDQVRARDSEVYKDWGELLTAYAHQLNKGDREAVLDDFYSGEKVIIPLEPRFAPIQNAQKYFKVYNKSRKTLRHLEHLMAQNQEEIDYLETVMVTIQQAESRDEIFEVIEELEKEGYLKERSQRRQRKLLKSQPRRFMSSEGLEILVGRNNRQNDTLTLRQANPYDLWLHTQKIPGTHVIIRMQPNNGDINLVPDSTLEEAASLAAYFSQAENSSKVPVDYTFKINVRKPGGAKPGMVIYDNYWTIYVNPQDERVKRLLSGL